MERFVIFKTTRSGRVRRGALAALVVSAPLACVPATAAEEDEVISRGCRELNAFVTVPVENVRDRVPEDYVLTTFPGDVAGPTTGGVVPVTDMLLRTFNCDEQTVDGVTRHNTTSVLFGPQVAFPEDGVSSPSSMGFFTMFWITDNPDLVKWFRRGTAMPQVHHVPGLRFTVETIAPGVSSGVVDAPSPAPWPFRVSAVLPEGVSRGSNFAVRWWGPVPGHRTLFFVNNLQEFHLRAATGTLTVAPGTPMAEMFDGHEKHAYFASAKFAKQVTTKALTDPPTVQ